MGSHSITQNEFLHRLLSGPAAIGSTFPWNGGDRGKGQAVGTQVYITRGVCQPRVHGTGQQAVDPPGPLVGERIVEKRGGSVDVAVIPATSRAMRLRNSATAAGCAASQSRLASIVLPILHLTQLSAHRVAVLCPTANHCQTGYPQSQRVVLL